MLSAVRNSPIIRSSRSVVQCILTDPSNRGARGRRLLMGLAWQAWKRTISLPLVLTLDNGLLFIADPRSGNSVGAIYTRIYESPHVEFVRRWVIPGGTLCDVGAHVGLFTLLIAPLFNTAWCFEPAADVAALLRRNLALNGLAAFQACELAVSCTPGKRILVSDGPFSGESRLVDGVAPSGLVSSSVPTVRLDDVLGQSVELSFLKVDVEGHEPEVLEGAAEALGRSRRGLLMFEANRTGDALAVVERIGWLPFALDEQGRPTISRDYFERAQNLYACGPRHPLTAILLGLHGASENQSPEPNR